MLLSTGRFNIYWVKWLFLHAQHIKEKCFYFIEKKNEQRKLKVLN